MIKLTVTDPVVSASFETVKAPCVSCRHLTEVDGKSSCSVQRTGISKEVLATCAAEQMYEEGVLE